MDNLIGRLGSDTRYLIASFPLALIGFVLLVTGFALGLGTLVIAVGAGVLAVTLALARRLGDAERRALPEVLGHPVAWPDEPAPTGEARGGWGLRATLGRGQNWLDLLHGVVTFPVTVAFFSVTLAWWAATVAALSWPLYGWILIRAIPEYTNVPQLIGLGEGYLVASAFYLVGGVLLAVLLPAVVRMLAVTRAQLSQVLLTRPGDTAAAPEPVGGYPAGSGMMSLPVDLANPVGAGRY